MVSRRTNEQWRRDVYRRCPRSVLPAAVKVLCLYLADHMVRTGASVFRGKSSRRIWASTRRAGERMTKAIQANYLEVWSWLPTEYGRVPTIQASECVQQSGNHLGEWFRFRLTQFRPVER